MSEGASKEPVRLAIVGSGNIAGTHADAIARIPEARLVAVCSRDPEKARSLAVFQGAEVFNSVEKLVASGSVDAVLIATPSGAHLDVVLPALRARKHVLCEKPLEISSGRVRLMIDAAAEVGVILGGFFPLRCGAGVRAVRHALDAGHFGRLTFLSARVKWWREQEYYSTSAWRGTWSLDGGGALMNQGIHAVDLMQWFGGRIKEVSAFSGELAHPGIEVEDTLAACLHFESGCLGTIEASTACYPGLELSLEISGDRGTAILVNDRIECWRFANELTDRDTVRAEPAVGQVSGSSSDPRAISCEGHRVQILEFCRAIRGERTDLISGREAGAAVAIVEAIYRSARSRKAETINYTV